MTCPPRSTTLDDIELPYFTLSTASTAVEDGNAQIMEEWLSLIVLESPRTKVHHKPNPYICRYKVPEKDESRPKVPENSQGSLTVIHWHGFLPHSLAVDLLILAKKAAACTSWWAMRSKGFRHENDVVSIMQMPSEAEDGRICYSWHSPN